MMGSRRNRRRNQLIGDRSCSQGGILPVRGAVPHSLARRPRLPLSHWTQRPRTGSATIYLYEADGLPQSSCSSVGHFASVFAKSSHPPPPSSTSRLFP